MVDIFTFDEQQKIKLCTENIHLIPEFNAVMKADKNQYKKHAFAIFTFIYLAHSYRSPYFNFTEVDRIRESKISAELTDAWKPSQIEQNAISKFKELEENTSPFLPTLQTLRKKINEIRIFIDDADLTEVDENGKPIHDVDKIIKIMNQLPVLQKTFVQIEESVKKDFKAGSSIRGNAEKGFSEDPD